MGYEAFIFPGITHIGNKILIKKLRKLYPGKNRPDKTIDQYFLPTFFNTDTLLLQYRDEYCTVLVW